MFRGQKGRRKELRMNRSMPQLLGFIVLAAIVLATGFGAHRLMAERYGGRYSPGGSPPGRAKAGQKAAPPASFRSGRARRVSLRARLMFLLPLPLLFAGLGAIGRGNAAGDGGRARRLRRADALGVAAQRGAAGRGGLRRPAPSPARRRFRASSSPPC